MKSILYKFMATAALALLGACSQQGMEYTILPKQVAVEGNTSFIDGFLIKGTPVYQGNGTEHGDRLAISFINGFNRRVYVNFVRPDTLGMHFQSDSVFFSDMGERQYGYFKITGTPTVEGTIPIFFNVYDADGAAPFGASVVMIRVWPQGSARPAPELIPNADRPFIFLDAELNWVNQTPPTAQSPTSQVFWYTMRSRPATSFSLSGITYNCSVNLHYNSILEATNAIRPAFVTTDGENIINVFGPTEENVANYPDAFRLKNGATSDTWKKGRKNDFNHGTNSKPVSVGIWDSTAPDVIVGSNRSRPFSSLTWNVGSTGYHPMYFQDAGTFKVWVQYVDTDAGNNFMQYFPKHPVTGEAGWVPYEITVLPNPVPGFVVDPGVVSSNGADTYNHNWEPTPAEPVKPIRGEVVKDEMPASYRVGAAASTVGASLRIWFASYRTEGSDIIPTYYFGPQTGTGWSNGFKTSDVEAIAGTGSSFGGGTQNRTTSESQHFFADPALNAKYFVTYVTYNIVGASVFNSSGIWTLQYVSPANSGAGSPKFPNGFTCPVNVEVLP